MTHQEFYQRHLPHWQPAGATFFVTFRLKDSLPCEVVVSLKEERERERRNLAKLTEDQRDNQNYIDEQRGFARWDAFLDKAEFGPRWLLQPEVAEVVREALNYRDNREYTLFAFCIMSNHVHAVFEPLQQSDSSERSLHTIMQFLKGYTGNKVNSILARTGPFWQDESYDHVIRDQEELQRIVHYVLGNPVKAGLATDWQEWPWSYCRL
jgi:REP element-mobilizing transposase RayT